MGGPLYHTEGETEATKYELLSSSIPGHGGMPEPEIPGQRAYCSRGQRDHGKILESHASRPSTPQQQLASCSRLFPISSQRPLAPGHKTSDQVQGSPQPWSSNTLHGHPILE